MAPLSLLPRPIELTCRDDCAASFGATFEIKGRDEEGRPPPTPLFFAGMEHEKEEARGYGGNEMQVCWWLDDCASAPLLLWHRPGMLFWYVQRSRGRREEEEDHQQQHPLEATLLLMSEIKWPGKLSWPNFNYKSFYSAIMREQGVQENCSKVCWGRFQRPRC